MPHEPSIKVYGIIPDSSRVMKSAVQPLMLNFHARYFPTGWQAGDALPDMSTYCAFFKNGDDLRQDQLVLQLFVMMDTLLKDINLDFKFTIYKVQAFSANDGIMYCVPGSMPV